MSDKKKTNEEYRLTGLPDTKKSDEGPEIGQMQETLAKKVRAIKTFRVKQAHGRVVDGRILCTTENREIGYLVPKGLVKADWFDIDPSKDDVLRLPSWNAIIEEMLPSREVMVRNIRFSFWLNGIIDEDTARIPRIQANAIKHAWPYPIKWPE